MWFVPTCSLILDWKNCIIRHNTPDKFSIFKNPSAFNAFVYPFSIYALQNGNRPVSHVEERYFILWADSYKQNFVSQKNWYKVILTYYDEKQFLYLAWHATDAAQELDASGKIPLIFPFLDVV